MGNTFRGRAAATAPAAAVEQHPVPLGDGGQVMRLDLEMADQLAKSELVPKAYRKKPENILIAVGLGRALGIDPVPSLYALHVIEGVPSPSAKTQQALVRRAGHKFRSIESTSERAVVEIVRHDDPSSPVRVEYTVADAETAGLLDYWAERWVRSDNGRHRETWPLPRGADPLDAASYANAPQWVSPEIVKRRDNWHTNRRTMLMARATTTCVGQACAEVLSGIDFDTAWQEPEFDVATIVDVEREIAGGAETFPSESDHRAVSDTPPVLDAGEGDDTLVEPSPAEVGDPGSDGAPGSPEGVVEAEVAAAPPSPPSPPERDPGDAPVSESTRDRAKAAKVAARMAGNGKALTAQLTSDGVPAQESKWTEAQALKVIEIAEGLS